MKGEIAVVVEFGVSPLFETISKDDDATAGSNLYIQLDMPVTEDIVVAVGVMLLLLFGKKHEFLLVLAFVRAGILKFFEPAAFCPFISDFISPCGWERPVAALQERRAEDLTQFHEPFDFLNILRRVDFFPFGGE